MANVQGIPTTSNWRLKGLTAAYPTSGLKAAVYLATASITAATTAYTATGEVSGPGYTAGGVSVTSATVPAITSNTAYWTPSAAISVGSVTLTAANHDCFMIYDTGDSNANRGVFTYTAQITAGTLSFTMPTNDATTGLVRIAWS